MLYLCNICHISFINIYFSIFVKYYNLIFRICLVIRDDGRYPKNLQTDKGKEFYNSDVQKLLKKCNINYYSTYFVMKASVVERFNCILKNMWKQFTYEYNGNDNGSTSCRIPYRITTCDSIKLSVFVPSMLHMRSLTDS